MVPKGDADTCTEFPDCKTYIFRLFCPRGNKARTKCERPDFLFEQIPELVCSLTIPIIVFYSNNILKAPRAILWVRKERSSVSLSNLKCKFLQELHIPSKHWADDNVMSLAKNTCNFLLVKICDTEHSLKIHSDTFVLVYSCL